ncbi:hypothetical protein [Nevskia ramosa]|uniref:hypothetical protein n=1 Tax=Nevskia ramosa TaxID=64002 RepID=UPI003D0F5F27
MPAPIRKRRRHLEDDHQAALFEWAAIARFTAPPRADKPFIGEWMFAIPNGGKRDPIEGARLKLQGVKAGVSDVMLPIPRKGYAGMWLELKTPATNAAAKGDTSPAQREWRDMMLAAGYLAVIVYGWDEAKRHIEQYLSAGQA